MLALPVRHGAELPVPGLDHSLDDAGERGPGEPLAQVSVWPGPGSSCRAVVHCEAKQRAGLAGAGLLLSDACAAARLHPAAASRLILVCTARARAAVGAGSSR